MHTIESEAQMGKLIGLLLVVVGAVLLYWGYETQESVGSQVTELVTGTPSDKAMWLLLGGAGCIVVGLYAAVRIRR